MITRPRLRSHDGCMPCKRRRKKCDEQKPTCGPCQRVNRRCFWKPEQEHEAGQCLVESSDPVLKFFIRRLRQEPSLSKSVDLSAFQDGICASQTLEICFKSSNSPFDPNKSQRNGWSIQSTLTFAPVDESLSWDCFLAHSLMFVGNRYKDHSLFEAGLVKHSLLLRRIRAIIQNEKKRCDHDTLAAISNLETFNATRSWNGLLTSIHQSLGVGHAAGMLAILETMQPQQFQSDRALALFEHTRFSKLVLAILCKRETCLTSESWKTVPWLRAKHTKNSLHILIDLLCEMVGLQSELYILTPYQGSDPDLSTSSIQGKVVMLLSQLRHWRQSADVKLRSRLEVKEQSAKLISSLGESSSSAQLEKAMGLCELGIFDMMLIYLCRFLAKDNPSSQTLDSLSGTSNGTEPPEIRLASQMMPLDLPIDDSRRRAHIAAKEIVTIWEVITSNDLIGIATIYLGLPLLVARDILAFEGDASFTHLNEALGQMPAFWSGAG